MNNVVNRFLLVLALFCSSSVFAEWGVNTYNLVSISESAQGIATDITQLPEQHFFSNQEYGQVKRLLSRTLLEQKKQVQILEDSLAHYQDIATDKAWANVEKNHRSLTSLNTSKELLLHLTETRNRDQLTGFGPRGVTQFYAELTITKLNIRYYIYYQIRSFKKLLNDLAISPVPVISVILKVLGIFFVFNWWMRNSDRLIHDFKTSKLKSTSSPSLLIRTIWYCSRAHKAIAYLLLITATLRIISTLPSLQHLIFLEIFTWWILGGSIAVSFILEFTYRNSKHNKKETIALRLSTIRRYVWGIIVAGVVLQISSRTLGEGTIYAWINSIVYLFFALLTVITLKQWNNTIFNRIEQLETYPLSVQWAIRNKNTLLMSIAATACGSAWLLGRTIQHQVISMLSQYAAFSHVLAYLFRIEVAKQTEVSREQSNLDRIKGDNAFDYIAPGSEESELLDEYAEEEITSLSRYLLTDSPAVCVLSGERGIGTTTVLNRILNKAKNVIPLYVNCPYDGYSALLPEFSKLLGLEEGATERDILHDSVSQLVLIILIQQSHYVRAELLIQQSHYVIAAPQMQ